MENIRPSAKKRILQLGWPLFYLLTAAGRAFYKLGLTYKFQMDWGALPNPEWFDHEYDLAFFSDWRKAHFFERGVYLQEILKKGQIVLDLCCGDGSVTALFISPYAERVVGVDFDPKAIARAKQKHAGVKNASFQIGDIRRLEFPKEQFDVITWDAAIEHFTQDEINGIFGSIQSVLKPNGLLAGSTVAKQAFVQHHDHEFEFDTAAELNTFLLRYFPHVFVWERRHGDRTNFYFRCSHVERDLAARSCS